MICFVVDPLLATVPEANDNADIVQKWISAIQAWIEEIHDSPFEWRHFGSCSDLLLSHQRLVDFIALRSIGNRHQIDFDPGMLSRRIAKFFQDPSHDYHGICFTEDACSATDDVEIAPREVIERNDHCVRDEVIRALLVLSCDKTLGHEFASSVRFVTLPLTSTTSEIAITADLLLTVPDTVAEQIGGDRLEQMFPIVVSPDDIVPDQDIGQIIELGEHHFARSVRVEASRRFHDDLLEFEFGPDFWDSLSRSSIDESPAVLRSLLRACCAVVAGSAKDVKGLRLEQVRASKTGNAPSRTRESDGARAWRASLSMGGAAWRLHYWVIPGQGPMTKASIEFHNVTQHDELI